MEIFTLAAITIACGGLAIFLWLNNGKLQEELAKIRARIDLAESEASKQADRAESMRRKLESTREQMNREDRPLKDARARAAEAKEESKRLQAALKKAEVAAEQAAALAHKAEARAEELAAMLAERSRKPEPTPVAPVVAEREIAPAEPAAPVVEDPKIALRRAELEAEREQRQLEILKVRQERDAWRAEQQASSDRDRLDRLLNERERLARAVFERELELRIARKKAEDNRRAYLMTMGALDIAEEEVYRLKHGRERPEFVGRRPDEDGDDEAVEPMQAATERSRATAAASSHGEPSPVEALPAATPEHAPVSQPAEAPPAEPVPTEG